MDEEFAKYLCFAEVTDIKNIYSLSEEIPIDVDNDILKAIIKATKDSTREFYDATKKMNISKELLKEVFKIYKDVIKKFKKAIKDNKENRAKALEELNQLFEADEIGESINKETNVKIDYETRFKECNTEEKRELNEVKEDIAEKALSEEDKKEIEIRHKKVDELREAYLNNIEIQNNQVFDEEVNEWYEYCKKWIQTSDKEYNEKRIFLNLDEDATIIDSEKDKVTTKENKKEKNIFKSVIFFRRFKEEFNERIIKKIIKFELERVKIMDM